MADRAKSWKNVVAEESVSASRAHIYERVMKAEERIARALYKRGESDANVQAALDAVDERLTEAERREDLYLSSLGHYLEALGGQLEVRAVFGDEAITLRRHPKS